MKKHLLFLIIVVHIISLSLSPIFALAENKSETEDEEKPYTPHAKHMLVCDVESGYEIYSKGSSESINPYGFTKILTAITVIENTKNLSKEITVPKEILNDYDYSYGNIGLTTGEKISVKNLLYAMMMQDAGDCAIALSHTTAKSYDDFIKLMNDTAKKAGAKNSVFTEPSGFEESKQKTTLYDMQKITSYALKNNDFCEITKTQRIEIPPTNMCHLPRIMFTTNRFLSRFYSEDYMNPNVSGVKGYYKDSSDTGLIIRYSNGTDDLFILTAKSDEEDNINYAYDDTLYLIEKGKGFFTEIKYIEKEEFVSEIDINTAKNTDRLLLISLDNIYLKLPKNYKADLITRKINLRKNIDAPLEKFEELGEINIYYDEFEVGSAKVAAYNKLEKSTAKAIKNIMLDCISSIHFWIILIILITVIWIINKSKKSNKKA